MFSFALSSVPYQVHRLVFMHDSIVRPLFVQELMDIEDKINYKLITVYTYITEKMYKMSGACVSILVNTTL